MDVRSRVESARAELEPAKINAEKVKSEAQAQSDSGQIIRCGAMSTTVKEMIAGKEANSVKAAQRVLAHPAPSPAGAVQAVTRGPHPTGERARP